MFKIWDEIKMKPVPDPTIYFMNNQKEVLPILAKESTRNIRTLIFNRFPGARVTCKLCYENLNSYMKHIESCQNLERNQHERFSWIIEIKIKDWNDIYNKSNINDI